MLERTSHFRIALLAIALCISGTAVAGEVDPLRLTHDVVPTFQSIRLEVDADMDDYTGSVHIELEVKERTSTFRFHAKGVDLQTLVLTRKKHVTPTTHTVDDMGFVTVTTVEPLAKGDYTLAIEFATALDRQAKSFYKVVKDGKGYTFTQFESEYAREAFPCWDEPIFKIPFQVTLVVPSGHLAISNTPIKKETVAGEWSTVVFEKTRPIPSYLLAIATGPFETVSIPGMSIPGRVVTVQGQSHLAAEAVEATPPVLAALEDYFGSKYPYKKLDVLAVPEFLFGAMENVGAVTFRDDLLLMDSEKASLNQKRFMTVVMGHELAHMWFGNLVTMKWWDDIWLNEAFATWMGYKSTDVAYPEYQFTTEDVRSRQGAMRTDALPSARAISHPFRAGSDPMELFDELTYQKGQAVLSMIEQWLGEEAFRQGMMRYIKKYRWKNATSDDLWDVLARGADVDVAASMGTFVKQPGVPLVKIDLMRDDLVQLSQKRFENYGQDSGSDDLWQIPMTLRYSDGENTFSQKLLLSRKSQTVELQSDKTPVWIHPNQDEKGYYHWDIPSEMLRELAARATEELTLRERMAFVNNLSALLDGGELTGVEYLESVGSFAEDPAPEVSNAVVDAISKIHKEFVTDELKGDFAVYVRQTLRPILDRIGVTKVDGEEGAVSRLRPRLVWWLAAMGYDEEAKQHALKLARAYEKDRASVDPSMIGTVLSLEARFAGKKRFEYYKSRVEHCETPAERRRYLGAIGSFLDPKVVLAALDYSFGPDVRPNEKTRIPVAASDEFREEVLEWVFANYSRVKEEVPQLHLAFMMPALVDGRSEKLLSQMETFLSNGDRKTPLMEKNLRKVADRVNRRTQIRKKEGAAVAAYLSELSQGG